MTPSWKMPLLAVLGNGAVWLTDDFLGGGYGEDRLLADLKDVSDEADDSSGGRDYGLYHRTRRSARPRVGPTECGGGFTVDLLDFGAGDVFRAPPGSLFVQVRQRGHPRRRLTAEKRKPRGNEHHDGYDET